MAGAGVARVLTILAVLSVANTQHNTTRDAKSIFNKLLAPLTIVRMPNVACTAPDGDIGTCVSKHACVKQGGKLTSQCGRGFGVCCVVDASENGVVKGNNTCIRKTDFNDQLTVSYTVMKMSEDICQFRLDVEEVTLGMPDDRGMCQDDYFTISQDTKYGRICGITKAAHFYLDVTDDFAVFEFSTSANLDFVRRWKFYVSQYTCDMGAPTGCGQWYWGTSGTIQIWNNVDPGEDNWYYLDDQEYGICVRTEAGYCSVTYVENQEFGFVPACDDLLERPGRNSLLLQTCNTVPPSAAVTYTVTDALQYFYIRFRDNSNKHRGSVLNPYGSLIIDYTQNACT